MCTTELPVLSALTPPMNRLGVQRQGYDLLQLRPVRALFLWWGFPYAIQAILLVIFVSLAVMGWGLHPPEGVNNKLFAKSNLVTLLVWGLWWPSMVWAAVLFGRIWCAICPLELVSNLTERLGRAVGVRQRVLGKWLRSGALIVGLYAMIQMWVAGANLHRTPAYTSMFLWGLLGIAALTGFFLRDRAFCRGFCPVGLLLATYGRGSMLAVRSISQETCATCEGRDCVRGGNRTKLDARSCPSLLSPARLNDNADCLVCGQCMKACPPNNLGLLLRRPFAAADTRESVATWPVTFFVMLVSGFVVSELCSEWKSAQAVFLWVPEELAAWLGPPAAASWIEGIWTLFAVPTMIWSLLGGLVMLLGGAFNLRDAWRRLALPLAVVISAGHMCKGLAKFTSWIGYLPLAEQDPVGVETSRALAVKALAQPASLLPMTIVSVTAIVLVVTAAGFGLRELRLAQGETHRRYCLPVCVLASSFLFIVFGWGFLK